MGKFLKRNEASSNKDAAQAASKKTQMAPFTDVSASEKTVYKRIKELDIDLVFEAMDDLVIQITCKTCKLFALANMALNFITGNST